MSFNKKTFYVFMMIGMPGITLLCYGETITDKTSIEELKKETEDLLEALNTYTVNQREEAIGQTKTALDNLDKRIDALEARIDESREKMDKAAREKARASLKALRKERTKVAEWYGSLKSSTGDAWENMKKGFSNAYKLLNDALEKSLKEFSNR
ncbi:MAG: hypothetical protein OEV42_20805 [Deltaproteobacteria bacterium]|nr:hypothetical protein [Deltaproteobacteria bacterium]